MLFKHTSTLFFRYKNEKNLGWSCIFLLIWIQRFCPHSSFVYCSQKLIPVLQTNWRQPARRTGWAGWGGGRQVKVSLTVAPTTQGSIPMFCEHLCFSILSRLRVSNTQNQDLNREYKCLCLTLTISLYQRVLKWALVRVLFSANLGVAGGYISSFLFVIWSLLGVWWAVLGCTFNNIIYCKKLTVAAVCKVLL